MICNAAFFKRLLEEVRNIMFDAHRAEHDSKLFIRLITERCLLYYLGGQLVVRQAVAGKYRELLPPDQRGQPVNR